MTKARGMLIYEYKLDGTKKQYAAIDEAIRIVQFVRNKCLRLWMDERGVSKNDLQCYCAVLCWLVSILLPLVSIPRLVKKSLSVRIHICHDCGVVLDRDHNAARNILAKAHGTLGHRGTHESSS